jgi:hypothetical protein
MKTIEREVKSKGQVVDTIKIDVPENLKEAVKHAGDEQKVCDAYVKTITDNAMNQARAAKVRPASPQAVLARMAKEDPKVKAKIDALLKELQG